VRAGHGGAALASSRGLHAHEAADKFSKWIEVRPIVKVHSKEVVAFFTNIIYHFGILNSIIIDNGTQFTERKFLRFCDDNNIRMDWAAVANPRMNGQVERANGMVSQGLKPQIFKRLEKF
jgi:IS30 family transposase